jgi:hypothetical protein
VYLLSKRLVYLQDGLAWLHRGHIPSLILSLYKKYLLQQQSITIPQDDERILDLYRCLKLLIHKDKDTIHSVVADQDINQDRSLVPLCVHEFIHAMKSTENYQSGHPRYLNSRNRSMAFSTLKYCGLNLNQIQALMIQHSKKCKTETNKVITEITWWRKQEGKEYGCKSLIDAGWCPHTGTSPPDDIEDVPKHLRRQFQCCKRISGETTTKQPLFIQKPSDYVKAKQSISSSVTASPSS